MKTGTATYGSFLFGGEEVSNSRCANRLTRLRKRLLQLWKAGLTKEFVVAMASHRTKTANTLRIQDVGWGVERNRSYKESRTGMAQ